MLITLKNSFHHTKTQIRVKSGRVSNRSGKRAWSTLCGVKECICGGQLGQRGPQFYKSVPMQIEPDFANDGDKRGNYAAAIIIQG